MKDELFEDIPAAKETAIVTTVSKEDALLEKVLSSGNIEILERFLSLREHEETRQAKREFDQHFSEMQAEFAPVQRTGQVWNKTRTTILYKFCPLENILKVYAPIIAMHCFSYHWSEDALEGKAEKRITCHVNGYGFERTAYIDIPIQQGNEFTNTIQQRGVSSSYGKRYSFINAFGVIIEDEDDEAALSFGDGVKYAEFADMIQTSANLNELNIAWQKVGKSLADDKAGFAKMSAVKDARKKELSNGTRN